MKRYAISLLLAASCTPTPAREADPVADVSSAPTVPAPPRASSAQTTAPPPDADRERRLREDVERVAIERTPGSEGWTRTRTLVTQRLEASGFAVEQMKVDEGRGVDVVGTKLGTERPKEIVVLSAHYDHIAGCNGADDNASGVAVVLEAVRAFAQRSFRRTVVLAFWDLEESGLVGSRAWASRAKSMNSDVVVAISLDGVGFALQEPNSQKLPAAVASILPTVAERLAKNDGKGNFITALGDTDSAAFLSAFERAGSAIQQPAFSVELSTVKRLLLVDAARSDHASFWLEGYPAVLVTDTANFRNPNYHCRGGRDDASTLDYGFLNRVATIVLGSTAEIADLEKK